MRSRSGLLPADSADLVEGAPTFREGHHAGGSYQSRRGPAAVGGVDAGGLSHVEQLVAGADLGACRPRLDGGPIRVLKSRSDVPRAARGDGDAIGGESF